MNDILFATAFLVSLYFAYKRLPRYLHIFQQDDYNSSRFLCWIIKERAFDVRVSLALTLVWVCTSWISASTAPLVENIFGASILAIMALFEENPRQVAKKKLVMTARAQRIFAVSVLFSGVFLAFALDSANLLALVVWVQLIPCFMALGNTLLMPYEAAVRNRFTNEAKQRLEQVDPIVIGITGSFGKTSVKHILGNAIEMNAHVLFTPGSVNTQMGIARVIRENLRNNCRFFIVEMGAYGKGSIKKLCHFTPPKVGIITAIGEAHYERFKSLEAVAKAKFELAESVISANGMVVIHEDVLNQSYAKSFVEKNRSSFVICGKGEGVDAKITRIEQTTEGLNIDLYWKNKTTTLFAPLYGDMHASNVALVFITAILMGLSPDRVAEAIRLTPQIPHRLEVKPNPSGICIIDDAYNSNPIGFSNALRVLDMIGKKTGGKRIIVTPGVAELGAKHDAIHALLGEKTAECADIVIAVQYKRIKSFCDAYCQSGGMNLVNVDSFSEANTWITQNAHNGDVVLLENDLPDLYEKNLTL